MSSGIDKIVAVVRAIPERSVRTALHLGVGVGLLLRRVVVNDTFSINYSVRL